MATLLDLHDAVARVVGGTSPDAARPRWFSGPDSGDTTGVAGLLGCWSIWQDSINNAPVGMVASSKTSLNNSLQNVLTQGAEFRVTDVRLMILCPRKDVVTQASLLFGFPDLVYAAFAAHVGLFGLANEYQAHVADDRGPLAHEIGGVSFLGWEFTVRVLRAFIGRTYTA